MKTRPLALALPLLAPPLAAGGGPSLDHSGAELGATLEIDVSGAPANAPVGLLFSPQAGEVDLAAGTLELDPAGLVLVGADVTDASGAAGFSSPLGTAAALAEAQLHLQAFVLDAGAPGGAVLTTAVHARIRGSRVYALDEQFGELVVFSAVHDDVVFRSGHESLDGLPGPLIFDAARSRGALVVDSHVLVFDNHFGDVEEGPPLVYPTLVPHPDGETFWALTGDDRFLRIAFATGAAVAEVDVSSSPGSLSHTWYANGDATLAYAELVDASTRAKLRIVDLVAGTDLGELLIGQPTDSGVRFVRSFGDWVLAASGSQQSHGDSLTQIDTATSPTSMFVHAIGVDDVDGMHVVPGAGELLAWHSGFQGNPEFEPFAMSVVPIGSPGPFQTVPTPQPASGSVSVSIDAYDLDDAGRGWFLRQCCKEPPSGDESGSLWSFDLATLAWGTTPNGLFDGPLGVAQVADAFGARVFLGRYATPAPGDVGKLDAYDAVTLRKETFPVGDTKGLRVLRSLVVQ